MIETTNDGAHKYQASHVKGICNGMLMCETREENKQKTSQSSREPSNVRINNKSRVRQRGSGPRQNLGDE